MVLYLGWFAKSKKQGLIYKPLVARKLVISTLIYIIIGISEVNNFTKIKGQIKYFNNCICTIQFIGLDYSTWQRGIVFKELQKK
jgi:hypothetical protein